MQSSKLKNLFVILVGILPIFQALSLEFTTQVIDKNGEPLANMVVYVTPQHRTGPIAINNETLIIDQQDQKFAPYIAVMQKGQAIKFNNLDDITHHIYSVSGGNRFEFKLKAGTDKVTEPMLANDEIAMGCNIHDWMSGYVLVVDTPYYGKTDGAGEVSFDLTQLGEYQVTVWHPQLIANEHRVSQMIAIDQAKLSAPFSVELPNKFEQIPLQENQEDFDFLDEY